MDSSQAQTTWPQEPVASENGLCVSLRTSGAVWTPAQRALCRKVTRENYTDVASWCLHPQTRSGLPAGEREAPGDPNPWEAEVLRGICPGGKSSIKTEELAVGPLRM